MWSLAQCDGHDAPGLCDELCPSIAAVVEYVGVGCRPMLPGILRPLYPAPERIVRGFGQDVGDLTQDIGGLDRNRDALALGQPSHVGRIAPDLRRRLVRLIQAVPADLSISDGEEPEEIERRPAEQANEPL